MVKRSDFPLQGDRLFLMTGKLATPTTCAILFNNYHSSDNHLSICCGHTSLTYCNNEQTPQLLHSHDHCCLPVISIYETTLIFLQTFQLNFLNIVQIKSKQQYKDLCKLFISCLNIHYLHS